MIREIFFAIPFALVMICIGMLFGGWLATRKDDVVGTFIINNDPEKEPFEIHFEKSFDGSKRISFDVIENDPPLHLGHMN